MQKLFCLFFSIFFFEISFCQIFSGDGIAIHKDSLIIKNWATNAVVKRGFINIADTTQTYTEQGITSNRAFSGKIENATGKADGQFISLGDGGEIILTFENPIINGEGPDFAIFENSLFSPPTQTTFAFLELAFVEVSSDGENFVRIPAISNCQNEIQIATFDAVDYSLFYNFAGLYPVFWGVPFDLEDINLLSNFGNLDFNNITHVKIIDAIGTINPDFASYDSQGHIVNDSYPTPFATCGFDLDAVGVIHSKNLDIVSYDEDMMKIFPNPAKEFIEIRYDNINFVNGLFVHKIKLINSYGLEIFNQNLSKLDNIISLKNIKSGVYFLSIETDEKTIIKKLIIIE
ncbi:MAG: T9SS type A sorting domain-containing protein [Bacteroidales bacterium]|jgi:hypothetical protein|nr:T9SS type A sorting domain-containing protein [Bacteroidales bacterium]